MTEGRWTIAAFAVCALLWAGIVLSTSKETLDSEIYEPVVPEAQVQAFAREQLRELQQRSFDEDVELCGIIAERSNGELMTRSVILGHEASCDISYFDVRSLLPRATFHTHAGYNTDYDSEVPSLVDLRGDIDSQLYGYISTPGGRFWQNDWRNRTARLVCGEGCLPQDPAYRACNAPAPEAEYTISALRQRHKSTMLGC